MARKIDPEESTDDEVRRIAHEDLEQAIELLSTKELDLETAVHEARKKIKRLRALLKLVRGKLGGSFDELNDELRSTARRLSVAREAAATLEAIDRLKSDKGEGVPEERFEAARSAFSGRIPNRAALAELFEDSVENLKRIRRRFDHVTLEGSGFGLLRSGFRRTYRDARRRLQRALSSPTPAAIHDLRKAVKAHQYHLQFLESAWPALMAPRRDALSDLGELLGQHHDLALLVPELRERGFEDLAKLGAERSAELQREILRQARRMLAEPARHLTASVAAWFDAAGRD